MTLFDGLKQTIDRRKMFALLAAAGAEALFPPEGNVAAQQQEAHHPTAGEEDRAFRLATYMETL